MDVVQIDLLTVLIAALLNFFIGWVWYSKWLFGPTWEKQLKAMNVDPNIPMKKINILYSFINSLVIAYFLSFFQAVLGVTSVADGMFIGFCIWFGFIATTQISSVFFAREPFRYFLVHSGFKLLSFLCMSGVIGA